MVGLSDIPCLGKVVDRLSDAIYEAGFRQLRYMFCYKDLLKDLDSKIVTLKIEEVRVSRKADEERANGKRLEDHVLKWLNDVGKFQHSVKEFPEIYKNKPSWRFIHRLPLPNPVSRFRLGRDAVQKTRRVIQLTDSGKELQANEIAYLPLVENVPKTDTAFQNFQSRKDAYRKLWEALLTEGDPQILGIYGMPGVGKTRIMEQIWVEAKDKGIFNKVTRANLSSEKLDVIKLQNDLAGYLHCHFISQDNVDHRASQLKNSLMNGGKILVILDDVWREIPLDIIGIPYDDSNGSKGCKILFISREEDVCLRNNCKHPVKIAPLTSKEAWDLLNNTVGTGTIDSLQDESLAKKVCNKCAGLPLIIHAVGKALKFMSHNLWKDALEQLENCEIENVPGIGPEVYACLKVSFDNLVEDAKPCLLLCSIFPEDADIPIKTLIQLAIGSQLVHGGRSRVPAMVDILKSSSLLLESKYEEHFKLHDIMRDVARSIAVKDPKYAFLFLRCGLRFPDNSGYDYDTRKVLHLQLEKNDFHFDNDLVFPHLHTLSIRSADQGPYKISIKKFPRSTFKNLRFLVLVNFSLLQEFSLQSLGKLRMLFLDQCNIAYIGDIDIRFFPENLETLCIWDCQLPVRLNLPNLKYLRKLEIIGKVGEVIFVPNTISSLSSLEELHIPNGFSIWDDGALRLDPIWDEISKLPRLTSLQILFNDFEPSQDTTRFSSLLEYNISMGLRRNHSPVSLTRLIQLTGYHLEVFQILMGRAEEMVLWRAMDVKLSSICSSNREAFADLRNMSIVECDTMEYLVTISQNEIQNIRQRGSSFSNLIILEIKNCSAIKYLFCNAVATCLVQLQELYIEGCPVMEAIIMNEGTSNEEIMIFPKLKSLTLLEVPRLTSFYRVYKEKHSCSTSRMDNSAISSVYQPLFDGMVEFPSLEELHIEDLDFTSDIWGNHYFNDNESSFCKLKNLEVSNCEKLEIVIPLALLHRLGNLEFLGIYSCNSLISEVGTYGTNTVVRPLVALSEMVLEDLPCLKKIGLNSRDHYGSMTLYPNLQKLRISDCNSLRNVFPSSIARELIQLEKLEVFSCKMMTEIIGAGEEEINEQEVSNVIVFPKLTELRLTGLHNLTSFWCYQNGEAKTYKLEFPSMVDIELRGGEVNLEAIELGRDNSACQLMSLDIFCDQEIQLPSKWQLKFYNLERLTLRQYCWWHDLNALCFHRLKVLKVIESRCTTLFSFSVFKSLQQLQEIEISNCVLLKEIVEDVRGDEASSSDKKTIRLFQLQSVILIGLPNLKSFLHGTNYECHMPALKEVKVKNCGLFTLFTYSVFRNLQQLEKLEVSNCKLLEGIVEDVREDYIWDTNDNIITLFRLSSVVLRDLPNLRSFSPSARYAFNMPELYIFRLIGCPRVENFTSLKTTTGYVYGYDGEKFPDLNDYIRQYRKRGSSLSNSNSGGESSYSNQEMEILGM
ncbi:disease resistance protein UNI-like [Apium graveolens]|uniref:disease resistance protein UNI-like n=1 Tax=Apium graveolens TaxID=4045 RepID=UPI003D7A6736